VTQRSRSMLSSWNRRSRACAFPEASPNAWSAASERWRTVSTTFTPSGCAGATPRPLTVTAGACKTVLLSRWSISGTANTVAHFGQRAGRARWTCERLWPRCTHPHFQYRSPDIGAPTPCPAGRTAIGQRLLRRRVTASWMKSTLELCSARTRQLGTRRSSASTRESHPQGLRTRPPSQATSSLVRCASRRSGASPVSGLLPYRLRWSALQPRESGGMADAPDLGSGARKGVGVRLPPLARPPMCDRL
jgi:hypothetical protein